MEEIEEGNQTINNFVCQYGENIHYWQYFGLYHRDWNVLIVACDIWDEIMDKIPNEHLNVYISISDNIDNNLTAHNIMDTFRSLMWGIIWYNNVCLLNALTTAGIMIEKPKKFKI